MNLNAVYECIGYGATRAVTSTRFEHSRSLIPARYILDHAKDPVAYCIEAYSSRGSDLSVEFDDQERALIMTRLRHEAGFSSH